MFAAAFYLSIYLFSLTLLRLSLLLLLLECHTTYTYIYIYKSYIPQCPSPLFFGKTVCSSLQVCFHFQTHSPVLHRRSLEFYRRWSTLRADLGPTRISGTQVSNRCTNIFQISTCVCSVCLIGLKAEQLYLESGISHRGVLRAPSIWLYPLQFGPIVCLAIWKLVDSSSLESECSVSSVSCELKSMYIIIVIIIQHHHKCTRITM